MGGARQDGISRASQAALQRGHGEIGTPGAEIKLAELIVGGRNPRALGVGQQQRLEHADRLVGAARIRESGADGKKRSGGRGIGGLGKFLQRGDGLRQLPRHARAVERSAKGVEPVGLVVGQLVGLLEGGRGEVVLLQCVLRATQAQVGQRDQGFRKRGRGARDPEIGRRRLVRLARRGVSLAQPVIDLVGKPRGRRGGAKGFQRRGSGGHVLVGQRDLGLDQSGFQADGRMGRRFAQGVQQRECLSLATLLEQGPSQTEVGGILFRAVECQDSAIFLLGQRKVSRIQGHLGLPIEIIGTQFRGHLLRRKGEGREGRVVATHLVKRLGLDQLYLGGKIGFRERLEESRGAVIGDVKGALGVGLADAVHLLLLVFGRCRGNPFRHKQQRKQTKSETPARGHAASSRRDALTLSISGAMVRSVKSKLSPAAAKSSGRGRDPPRLRPAR